MAKSTIVMTTGVLAVILLVLGSPPGNISAKKSSDDGTSNQADTEQKFSDAQGRPCTFGPSHDECQYQFLEKIPGTPNYIDYHSGFKVGYHDGFNEGIYHHDKDNAGTTSFSDGYAHG